MKRSEVSARERGPGRASAFPASELEKPTPPRPPKRRRPSWKDASPHPPTKGGTPPITSPFTFGSGEDRRGSRRTVGLVAPGPGTVKHNSYPTSAGANYF
jgi:hypothetical protein